MQLGEQALGLAFGVALGKIVPPEVAVGLPGGEHVPVGDENRVLDGSERAAVTQARLQALVLRGEVGVFGASDVSVGAVSG